METRNIYAEYLDCLNTIKIAEKLTAYLHVEEAKAKAQEKKPAELGLNTIKTTPPEKPTLLGFLGGETGAGEKRPFDKGNREAVFKKMPDIEETYQKILNEQMVELQTMVEEIEAGKGKLPFEEISQKLANLFIKMAKEIEEGIGQIQEEETAVERIINPEQIKLIKQEAALSYIFNAITAASKGSNKPVWLLCNRISHVYNELDVLTGKLATPYALYVLLQPKVNDLFVRLLNTHIPKTDPKGKPTKEEKHREQLRLKEQGTVKTMIDSMFKTVGTVMFGEMLNEYFDKLYHSSIGGRELLKYTNQKNVLIDAYRAELNELTDVKQDDNSIGRVISNVLKEQALKHTDAFANTGELAAYGARRAKFLGDETLFGHTVYQDGTPRDQPPSEKIIQGETKPGPG